MPHGDDIPAGECKPEVLSSPGRRTQSYVALEYLIEGDGGVSIGDYCRLPPQILPRLLRVGEVEDDEVTQLRTHLPHRDAVLTRVRRLQGNVLLGLH